MEKMTRTEFIKSKQTTGKKSNLQINLTAEEADEIEHKAKSLGLTRANYAKSILFYSD